MCVPEKAWPDPSADWSPNADCQASFSLEVRRIGRSSSADGGEGGGEARRPLALGPSSSPSSSSLAREAFALLRAWIAARRCEASAERWYLEEEESSDGRATLGSWAMDAGDPPVGSSLGGGATDAGDPPAGSSGARSAGRTATAEVDPNGSSEVRWSATDDWRTSGTESPAIVVAAVASFASAKRARCSCCFNCSSSSDASWSSANPRGL